MSIKSNFLISIEEKSDKSDFADNIILQNNYVFDAGKNLKIKPSILFREDFKAPTNIDLNLFFLGH